MSSAQSRRPKAHNFSAVAGSGANALEAGRCLDQAIALFREAMPGHGLKLIVPPPLPDGTAGRVSLSAWSRGDASARVYAGSSAQEALSRLFCTEAAAESSHGTRQNCRICHGVGWYIAVGGARTICGHP
jgi:hypothetical protein